MTQEMGSARGNRDRMEGNENMKKIIKAGICVAAAAMIMTGCGNKNQNAESSSAAVEETASAPTETETKSEEELHDEESVTLGDYKNLTFSAKEEEVTDAKIETRLKELCAEYPVTIEGRPAQEGDTANIDYSGTKDGEAFAGGTAEGYDLKLGSGTFIDGFEDGVIGMNVGDEKDLNLKFPDNYSSADLAGQEVVFHVKLNQLKSEADSKVDDDLAKRYYNDDTATLDQLKEEVRAELQAEADSQFFNAAGSELLNEVINNSEVTADPDAVDDMFNQLKNTYSSYASSYGLEFDQFLSMFLGTDEDVVSRDIENEAEREMLLAAVSELGPREQEIMQMRFGLCGGKERTQKEVAEAIGISQSYISRLEKKIIRKLRKKLEEADQPLTHTASK